MLKTQNYGFNKPELSDSPPDITVMNPNWDTIDKKIKENTDAIAQNSEAIGTVKTEITKIDMSWDKISGKPNSFIPSTHSHTKADIGLGSVQNYGVATQAQVDEGKANNLYVTPLSLAGLKQSVVNGKQAIVNAINDIVGVSSLLTSKSTHIEIANYIKSIGIRKKSFDRIMPHYAVAFAATGLAPKYAEPISVTMTLSHNGSRGDSYYCPTIQIKEDYKYIITKDAGFYKDNRLASTAEIEIMESPGSYYYSGGQNWTGHISKVLKPGIFYSNSYASGWSGNQEVKIAYGITQKSLDWMNGSID